MSRAIKNHTATTDHTVITDHRVTEVPVIHTYDAPTSRPTFLCNHERFTPSLLDPASYSPFPIIIGSRADHFDLNAHLLHPEQQICNNISSAPSDNQYEARLEAETHVALEPPLEFKEMEDSPLLQQGNPSLRTSAGIPLALTMRDNNPERKTKKFSDLVSTAPSAVSRDEAVYVQQAAGSFGKKGLSRFFGKRKSVTTPFTVEAVIPSTFAIPAGLTLSFSSTNLSFPSSARSSMILPNSESSSSNTTCLDPLQAPDDHAWAVSSLEIESLNGGGLKTKVLPKWLGLRSSRLRPLAPGSGEISPSISPHISFGRSSQPTLPSMIIHPPSRISPTPEQRSYALIGAQVRRVSYRKSIRLRTPSPHPLEHLLRRWNPHWRQEVANLSEEGQISHPRSVNPNETASAVVPAQKRLWCLLAVKFMVDQLDRGAIPLETLSKSTKSTLTPTPSQRKARGMQDFIFRLPFRNRHHVLYPDGTWSPIKWLDLGLGYGIWNFPNIFWPWQN